MSRLASHTKPSHVPRPALSMIEVTFSMVLIGGLLLSAMNMVGAAGTTMLSMSDRGTGNLLAEQLMAEILAQAYEDPDELPGSFGMEGFESVTKDRSYFDDVDDYDRWAKSPPQYKDGSSLSYYQNWKRLVTVQWVQPADTSQVAESSSGVKLIQVTVTHDGVIVAQLLATRADLGAAE